MHIGQVGQYRNRPPFFFSWSTARIHSWSEFGGRETSSNTPDKLPVFVVLPRSLAAPASCHKAPQRGLWLLLRHPAGALKSHGLWSQGQHGPQKPRRDTAGRVPVVCVWCHVSAKQRICGQLARKLSNPGGAVPWCHSVPCHAEISCPVAITCPRRRRFEANIAWSCRPSCLKICTPLTRGLLLCGHTLRRAWT